MFEQSRDRAEPFQVGEAGAVVWADGPAGQQLEAAILGGSHVI